MLRKLILALGIAAFSLTAAACNTVKGAGKTSNWSAKPATTRSDDRPF